MRARTVLILMALLLVPFRGQAATPAQYDQALAHVQAALTAQEQALKVSEVPAAEAPALVAQTELGPIHSIEQMGTGPQLVDTGRLIASIRAAGAVHDPQQRMDALQAVALQITLLRDELHETENPPSPATVEQSARAVLAKSEFAADPLPPQSLAERFAAWLDQELNKLHGPQYNGPAPSINPHLILGLFVTVAVAAFAVLVFVLVQALRRRGRTKSAPLALDEAEAALVEARDNDSLLGLAEQHAKAGDYRRAFRLVYLAALVALDTDGVLRFNKSKTNWEYLRALRAAGRSDVTQAMTPLTRDFDRVWYGFGKTDAADYANALAQYQALQAAPTAGRP